MHIITDISLGIIHLFTYSRTLWGLLNIIKQKTDISFEAT
jgi:hypothetical protein